MEKNYEKLGWGSQSPNPFLLTALVGDDIGSSIMFATNKVLSCAQISQRIAGNMTPMIPFSVILEYSVCLFHLEFYTILIHGLLWYLGKKSKPILLLTIYPALRPHNTISSIPTPRSFSHVQLRQALHLIIRVPLTGLNTNFSDQGTSELCHSETPHICPGFVNQGHLFRPTLPRVLQSQIPFHKMSRTHWVDLPDLTSPDPIGRTYAPLTQVSLARLS